MADRPSFLQTHDYSPPELKAVMRRLRAGNDGEAVVVAPPRAVVVGPPGAVVVGAPRERSRDNRFVDADVAALVEVLRREEERSVERPNGVRQCDIGECVVGILDSLVPPGSGNGPQPSDNFRFPGVELFFSPRSRSACPACNYQPPDTSPEAPYRMSIVRVPMDATGADCYELQELFVQPGAQESTLNCEACRRAETFKYTWTVVNFPTCLLVEIRFQVVLFRSPGDPIGAVKIPCFVTPSPAFDVAGCRYNLAAFVLHLGGACWWDAESARTALYAQSTAPVLGGHYIAVVMRPDRRWYEADDAKAPARSWSSALDAIHHYRAKRFDLGYAAQVVLCLYNRA